MIRIILAVCLVLTPQVLSQHKELTVEDIFTNRQFYGKSLYGVKWSDEGNKFSFLGYDEESRSVSIYEHDVKTGSEEILVRESDLIPEDTLKRKEFPIENYYWSSDEKYILFTELLPSRGKKTGGGFYIYSLKEKELKLSVESEEPQVNIKFSPDCKKTGFVRNNNLFIMDLETKNETQLTFDGSEVILNGVFDWVYEEEFSIIEAWEWSPDSRRIAFWRLDQSAVPEFNIVNWDSIYPQVNVMRYPKPGFPNSSVKIGVIDLESKKTTWMDIGEEPDIYIPRIKFTADPKLLSIQ
ncbi:MAG: DPP IV N-terminal domain-containing protein, partial [Ignavibacteria bacterium]